MVDVPACATCRFYTKDEYAVNKVCRRSPPFATMFANPPLAPMSISYWPSPPPTAWCGEYRPEVLPVSGHTVVPLFGRDLEDETPGPEYPGSGLK